MKFKALFFALVTATLSVAQVGSAASATTLINQRLTNDNGWRPAWGIDRIDQRSAVLDDTYNYGLTGAGVTVYVFDSGINAAHEDFGGRVGAGFSSVPDSNGTNDCSGHGTHSAGLIGGARYGVAKSVTLIPVRVLNCISSGSASYIYPAVDWIIQHHQAGVPAVVSMSIGMSRSIALNDAVKAMIADGLIVVAAAGNQNRDACLYSPASELSAISVGAIDRNEARANYSNFGACVDIFAPGSDLVAAWFDSPTSYRSTSGTSNAAPIVSGIVALMLQANPNMTQQEVESRLKEMATKDVIANIGTGSPNLLAYSLQDGTVSAPVQTTVAQPPATTAPVTTTVSVVTTTSPASSSRQQTAIPATLICTRPGARTRITGVPYVCVNTGNQLLWIPKRYSPGRP